MMQMVETNRSAISHGFIDDFCIEFVAIRMQMMAMYELSDLCAKPEHYYIQARIWWFASSSD
jgi:hypothetical protein